MKGFYKIPSSSVGRFLYGDMTGHRIDLVGVVDADTYYFVSDDDCPLPVPVEGNNAQFEYVAMTTELASELKPQAAGDVRAAVFPDPDIAGFFDALVLAILQGSLPGDVHSKAKMILDLRNPTIQAQAMGAFSQGVETTTGQPYTVQHKAVLNQLIEAFHLELPTLPT